MIQVRRFKLSSYDSKFDQRKNKPSCKNGFAVRIRHMKKRFDNVSDLTRPEHLAAVCTSALTANEFIRPLGCPPFRKADP